MSSISAGSEELSSDDCSKSIRKTKSLSALSDKDDKGPKDDKIGRKNKSLPNLSAGFFEKIASFLKVSKSYQTLN
jgi:hypothetical protein